MRKWVVSEWLLLAGLIGILVYVVLSRDPGLLRHFRPE